MPRRPEMARTPPAPLHRDRILEAAHGLLEEEGWPRFSMRRLAAALQVDPMALYHYFPHREALLQALVARIFAPLAELGATPSGPASWQADLEALAGTYLAIARRAPGLIQVLAAGAGEASWVAETFARAMAAILAPLHLSRARLRTATHLLVDALHGFAMAGEAVPQRAWAPELAMLAQGIEAFRAVTPRARPRGGPARGSGPGR